MNVDPQFKAGEIFSKAPGVGRDHSRPIMPRAAMGAQIL